MNRKNLSSYIYNFNNRPSKALIELLDRLQIPHDHSWTQILAHTQKKWLRKKERWLVNELYKHQKKIIFEAMKHLGCIEAIHPQKTEYDYILLLGCPYQKFLIRLGYLEKILKRITYKQIFILSGHRPLDAQIEMPLFESKYAFQAKHESEMINTVLKEKSFKKYAHFHLSLPMIDTITEIRRPNTEDTVKAWNLLKLPHKRCLIISNQPYVGYQDSVVRTYLEPDYDIETVGDRIYQEPNSAVFLDNLTRWIYQENQRCKLTASAD